MKSENHGEILDKCGTPEVAGKSSNLSTSAGKDYSLVKSYSYSVLSHDNSSLGHISIDFNISLPAYPPARSAFLNISNTKDIIKAMHLIEIDSSSGRNRSTYALTATNGEIVSHHVEKSQEDKDMGTIHVHIRFEQMQSENKITQTHGQAKTSDAG